MSRRKQLARLDQSFGRPPQMTYFPGDMAVVRNYFDHVSETDSASFFLDDTTWDDLDMDSIFRRMSHGLSTSGEQYLYYQLRKPAIDADDFSRRAALVRLMEEDPLSGLHCNTAYPSLDGARVSISAACSSWARLTPESCASTCSLRGI